MYFNLLRALEIQSKYSHDGPQQHHISALYEMIACNDTPELVCRVFSSSNTEQKRRWR